MLISFKKIIVRGEGGGGIESKTSYLSLFRAFTLHVKKCGQSCGPQAHMIQNIASLLGIRSAGIRDYFVCIITLI